MTGGERKGLPQGEWRGVEGAAPYGFNRGAFVIVGVDAHIDPMQNSTGLERADVGIGPYGFY